VPSQLDFPRHSTNLRRRRAPASHPDPTTDSLLQPFRLEHLTLKNRLMTTAHEAAYAEDGLPKDLSPRTSFSSRSWALPSLRRRLPPAFSRR
jgi:hypothetical protein